MTGLIEFSLITSIILIILSQDIGLRLYGSERVRLKVNFTLFALEFSLEKKKKRKKKVALKKKIARGLFIFRLASDLLSQSDVEISALDASIVGSVSGVAKMIGISITVPTLLAYLGGHARRFEVSRSKSEEKLDILFSFPLIAVFISLLKVSYYTLKSKIGRRYNNA